MRRIHGNFFFPKAFRGGFNYEVRRIQRRFDNKNLKGI